MEKVEIKVYRFTEQTPPVGFFIILFRKLYNHKTAIMVGVLKKKDDGYFVEYENISIKVDLKLDSWSFSSYVGVD